MSFLLKDGYRCPMSYKSCVIKLLRAVNLVVTRKVLQSFHALRPARPLVLLRPSPRRWMGAICRECYSQPEDLYATLKRRGMDLITLTDHDSIEGASRCGAMRIFS